MPRPNLDPGPSAFHSVPDRHRRHEDSSARVPVGGHGEKKERVLVRLREFFERFFGLGVERDQGQV